MAAQAKKPPKEAPEVFTITNKRRPLIALGAAGVARDEKQQMTSHTVPSEPAVVLRSNYVHVRALLSVAVAAIVGLTIAVVLLAANNGSSTAGTSATSASAAAIHANAVASGELGARLDHSGRNIPGAQALRLATGSRQVTSNPDQSDLIGSGSASLGSGARFFGPRQLGAYPVH